MRHSHFCPYFHNAFVSAVAATIFVCVLLLCGCAAGGPAVQPDTNALPNTSDHMQLNADVPEITYEQFCKQMKACESIAGASDALSLELLRAQLPDFAQSIEREPEQISLFCFQDLLDPAAGTNPIRLESAPQQNEPLESEKIKAAILCDIIDLYDPCGELEPFEGLDHFAWLALYSDYVLKQFSALDFRFDDSFYEDHPIQKQFLTAVLREPSWRIWKATPTSNPSDDLDAQMIRVDAANSFITLFETGTCSENISITPLSSSVDTEQLCTETTTWSILQADDQTVTLHIITDGDETVDIVYTP
ncbi:MAG: hypothetical protein ACI4PM_00920 [Butyricicoccus sp.]